MIQMGKMYYWRFKGEKAYRFGFTSEANWPLIRMGCWNGDYSHGTIVDINDIEYKNYD